MIALQVEDKYSGYKQILRSLVAPLPRGRRIFVVQGVGVLRVFSQVARNGRPSMLGEWLDVTG